MCRLKDIKATNYSNIISTILQKKSTPKDIFVLIDDNLATILELFDEQFSSEKNTEKLHALKFIVNVIEKIQYVIWCSALRYQKIYYAMKKSFIEKSQTDLFLQCREVNDYLFNPGLSNDILNNMLEWTILLVKLAKSLFPHLSTKDFQEIFFETNNFRLIMTDFYHKVG